jgi:hypothetical protein
MMALSLNPATNKNTTEFFCGKLVPNYADGPPRPGHIANRPVRNIMASGPSPRTNARLAFPLHSAPASVQLTWLLANQASLNEARRCSPFTCKRR